MQGANEGPAWARDLWWAILPWMEKNGWYVVMGLLVLAWIKPMLDERLKKMRSTANYYGSAKIEEFEAQRAVVREMQQTSVDQASSNWEQEERERRARAVEARLADLDAKAEAYHMKPPGQGRKLGDGSEDDPPQVPPPKPVPPAKKSSGDTKPGGSGGRGGGGGGGRAYNPLNPSASRSTYRPSGRSCGPRGG